MRTRSMTFWMRLAGCSITVASVWGVSQRAAAQSPQTHRNPASSQRVYAPGEVNTEFSRVYVHVGKTGLGHEHAVEGRINSGVVRLGATQDAGGMVFDMTSFIADTAIARKFIGLSGTPDASTQKKVNANMLGPDVLGTRRFPIASCKIRSSRLLPKKSRRGLPQYQFEGDFMLHGVTQKGQVIAEVEEQNGWVHIRGAFTMLQSQFGIKPYTTALGAIGVADRLEIYGDLWVAKENSLAQTGGAVRP